MPDRRQRLAEQRQPQRDERIEFEPPLPRHRADCDDPFVAVTSAQTECG